MLGIRILPPPPPPPPTPSRNPSASSRNPSASSRRATNRALSPMMLKSIAEVVDPDLLINSKPQLLFELVQILKDQIFPKATKAALTVLIAICKFRRNRIRAAEVGLVGVLINLLLESSDKRSSKMTRVLINLLLESSDKRSSKMTITVLDFIAGHGIASSSSPSVNVVDDLAMDHINDVGGSLEGGVLKSIHIVVWLEDELKDGERGGLECAVCLCEVREGERARILPKCNHGFHVECIDMWFYSHATCPLCIYHIHQSPWRPHVDHEWATLDDDDEEDSNTDYHVLAVWDHLHTTTRVLLFGEFGVI